MITLFGVLQYFDFGLSQIDTKIFLIPIFLFSLYVILKHEIPKLKLEISSKILTVFLCAILLSSTVTGFANFVTPESFAEESFEGIIEDSSNVN
ncbi:hypothetical protein, partial [Nitrosopumilus sp. S6]